MLLPLACNMILAMSQLRRGTSDVYTKTEIPSLPDVEKIAFDQVSWAMERSNQDGGLVQRGGDAQNDTGAAGWDELGLGVGPAPGRLPKAPFPIHHSSRQGTNRKIVHCGMGDTGCGMREYSDWGARGVDCLGGFLMSGGSI
jgi:hypothetical protein